MWIIKPLYNGIDPMIIHIVSESSNKNRIFYGLNGCWKNEMPATKH